MDEGNAGLIDDYQDVCGVLSVFGLYFVRVTLFLESSY
jgi:hypothetical protein